MDQSKLEDEDSAVTVVLTEHLLHTPGLGYLAGPGSAGGDPTWQRPLTAQRARPRRLPACTAAAAHVGTPPPVGAAAALAAAAPSRASRAPAALARHQQATAALPEHEGVLAGWARGVRWPQLASSRSRAMAAGVGATKVLAVLACLLARLCWRWWEAAADAAKLSVLMPPRGGGPAAAEAGAAAAGTAAAGTAAGCDCAHPPSPPVPRAAAAKGQQAAAAHA